MYIIRDIDVSTLRYVDGIDMKMSKRIVSMIPEKFSLLVANSMFFGIFPSEWSTSTFTLLPKTGDKTRPGKWRPISNNNIFTIFWKN